MDTHALKYFICAATHLNFTKAAKECYITQTAMSLRMAKLEEELGFRLFYRQHRKLSLTPAGELFLLDAQKLVKHYDQAIKQARDVSLGYECTLRIGYSHFFERLSLPAILPLFRQHNPEVKIYLEQQKQWVLREQLKQGMLDVILMSNYELVDNPDIVVDMSYKFPLQVLLSSTHKFAGQTVMTSEMMREVTAYIVDSQEMPILYHYMDDEWRKLGIRPLKIIEVDSLDTILLYVESGFGMAILPNLGELLSDGRFAFLQPEMDVGPFVISFAHNAHNKNAALSDFITTLHMTESYTTGICL